MARTAQLASEGLSAAAISQIAQSVGTAVAQTLARQQGAKVSTRAERQKKYAAALKKEAALARALTTESGLKKIAANITS